MLKFYHLTLHYIKNWYTQHDKKIKIKNIIFSTVNLDNSFKFYIFMFNFIYIYIYIYMHIHIMLH